MKSKTMSKMMSKTTSRMMSKTTSKTVPIHDNVFDVLLDVVFDVIFYVILYHVFDDFFHVVFDMVFEVKFFNRVRQMVLAIFGLTRNFCDRPCTQQNTEAKPFVNILTIIICMYFYVCKILLSIIIIIVLRKS